MARVRGYECILRIQNQVVGFAKDVTVNRSATMGDAKCRGNGGWDNQIQCGRGWSVDLDLLYDTNDLAYNELWSAWANGGPVSVTLTKAGFSRSGIAYVSDLTESQPLEDMVSVSVSLSGAGAIS